MHGAQITDLKDIKRFATAGRARLTLVSEKTGQRFTYQVKLKKGADDFFFVSVLTGANNEANYTYLGYLRGDVFVADRKLRIGADAPSRKAWNWFWGRLTREKELTACEVWHEGRCGRCSRVLTVPASIKTGLGPICAGLR